MDVKTTCLLCGAEFVEKSNNQRYCSARCRASETVARKRQRYSRYIGEPSCVICLGPIDGDKHNLTCSRLCRNALHGARKAVRSQTTASPDDCGACINCGGPTKIATSSQRPFKYCSHECRHEYARKTRGTKVVNRKCGQCKRLFECAERSNQKFCGADCRIEHERDKKRKLSNTCHVRRCKKFGSYFEHVDPKEIYRRDKWICQICMAPVNPLAQWPEDDCATLDHVVALSQGGRHAPDNLQCAHAACNIKKKDKAQIIYG